MFVVTAKEMYDIDHYTMQEIGYGNLLMENAGRAVTEKICAKVSRNDRIIVFVGPGNNGGDGYVIARTLFNNRYTVDVVQVVSNQKMTEEALFHKRLYVNCGGGVYSVHSETNLSQLLANADVVIDAILGIGVKGKLREPLQSIVQFINGANKFVISVDIPSGLPADEGMDDFISVQADYTVAIGALKLSAFLATTAQYYGSWDVVSIGHPLVAFERYAKRFTINQAHFQETMSKRKADSHKGDFGRGLVIGGSNNMPGALAMTVKAALRTGAGRITAGSTEKAINRIAGQCLESMYQTLNDQDGYLVYEAGMELQHYDAVALGIGLGRKKQTEQLVKEMVKQIESPLIIDADGLFHLQHHLPLLKTRKNPTIITPHPGEMARLLKIDVPELLRAPYQYSLDIATTYEIYVVLKGRYTIITTPDGEQAINVTGNQGLAKGGSGDVLTGIILGMVLQNRSIFQALCNACFVHGMSADLQVSEANTYYDLLATDVIEGIAKVYRTLSYSHK